MDDVGKEAMVSLIGGSLVTQASILKLFIKSNALTLAQVEEHLEGHIAELRSQERSEAAAGALESLLGMMRGEIKPDLS